MNIEQVLVEKQKKTQNLPLKIFLVCFYMCVILLFFLHVHFEFMS